MQGTLDPHNNTLSLLSYKRYSVWRYCNNLCLGISVMFLHFPLNILTSPLLHTQPIQPQFHPMWKPSSLTRQLIFYLLSTSNLTAIFAGYTARKLNFQQSQRYNILLLCGPVKTINILCDLCVLHQGWKIILKSTQQVKSPVSECRMTMIV